MKAARQCREFNPVPTFTTQQSTAHQARTRPKLESFLVRSLVGMALSDLYHLDSVQWSAAAREPSESRKSREAELGQHLDHGAYGTFEGHQTMQ